MIKIGLIGVGILVALVLLVGNLTKEDIQVLRSKNRIGIVKIGLKVIGGLVTCFLLFFAAMLVFSLMTGVTEVYRSGSKDKVSVLHVNGTIMSGSGGSYNHGMFMSQLEEVFSDSSVKAVVIQMDTPGGGVIESEEIYKKINDLKSEYNKPYVSYMNSMAASGGYYISANADKIVANKNTLTGSIGVIMSSLNIGELLEDYGVKMEVIKSGKHKDIMSAYREMTDEEREILQSFIDESYGYFVDIVAEGRDIPKDEVITIADGRVYSAKQALKLNLVDEIGDLDAAIAVSEGLANIENATVVEYWQTPPLLSSLGALTGVEKPFAEIDGSKGLKINIQGLEMRPMYIYGY